MYLVPSPYFDTNLHLKIDAVKCHTGPLYFPENCMVPFSARLMHCMPTDCGIATSELKICEGPGDIRLSIRRLGKFPLQPPPPPHWPMAPFTRGLHWLMPLDNSLKSRCLNSALWSWVDPHYGNNPRPKKGRNSNTWTQDRYHLCNNPLLQRNSNTRPQFHNVDQICGNKIRL